MLVFVFRINHDNARVKHHGTQDLELHKIAFSGAGLGKDHHVGVFELEPIEENKAVIVTIDTVEDTVIRREVGGYKRKRR